VQSLCHGPEQMDFYVYLYFANFLNAVHAGN
jgi:hypothetical protein